MLYRLLIIGHRYVGLTIAAFLIVAGLTGSVIAFHRELDAWLNPELFSLASRASPAAMLSPAILAEKVEAVDSRVVAAFIEINVEPGRSATVLIEPRHIGTATSEAVGYDQVFIDPTTGHILGRRDYGRCCFERQNVIPFLYELHRRLAMPGHWGDWLMGGVAVLWVMDCFVGLALTFPRSNPFWKRWQTAWKIKTGASTYRLLFDFHRASGLWVWIVLLGVATSSVYLNLGQEVFRPIVGLFSPLAPPPAGGPLDGRDAAAHQSFDQIATIAADLAVQRGWMVQPTGIYFAREEGLYIVDFGSLDDSPLGVAWAAFDAATGQALQVMAPGTGSPGDRFVLLQLPLHSGHILGLPGRIAICISGLLLAGLSITGVIIWHRKQSSRNSRRLK